MKKKFISILTTLLISAMAFTGCGSGTGTKGNNSGTGDKILVTSAGGEPGSLHPGLAQMSNDIDVVEHIFEGLMKMNEKGEIVPGIAESYEVSDDQLTYTFKLRDAKWSNGDTVTAGDFEYAWKYVLNPETASDYAFQMYYLANGKEYNEGKASADDVGVKAIDDKTLEVKLSGPTPYFLYLISTFTYCPIDKAVAEANPDWANDASTFVSNGPFSLKEWAHDSEIDLVKNENYYNAGAVKLDGLKFVLTEDNNTLWQMYQNNELDCDYNLTTEVLGKLREEKNPELSSAAALSTYYYSINTTQKPFNNVKVRKALAMSIDRQSIIDNVTLGGQWPAYGIVPEGMDDGNGDFRKNGGAYFKEDVTEAKKLLAEGLKEEGMDSLSFKLAYNTSEGHKKIAEAIQQMWKDNLGVDVTLENYEFKVLTPMKHNLEFDVARAGWNGDYLDPNTFLDMFVSTNAQSDSGWKSPEYDALIANAAKETDVTKRMGYLHDAEKMLMDQMVFIPIYYYTDNFTTKPYVTGVVKTTAKHPRFTYADINK